MHNRIMMGLFSALLLISAPLSADEAADKGTMAWSPDMKCAECHPHQVKSMTDPGRLVSVHVENGFDECISCHEPETLKQVHENVTSGKAFIKARRYPNAFCLKCHGPIEDLAARTADSKALTDTKGRVVNPHDIPQNEKHYKTDECATCHKMHKKTPDVVRSCTGCHHTGEFVCGTCHP